jgi:hypothetical protein
MGSTLAIEGDTTAGVEMGGVVAETTTDVSALSLDFELETPHQAVTEGRALVGTWTTATATKERDEFPVAKPCQVFGVRLTKTALTSRIEVSSVEVEWE